MHEITHILQGFDRHSGQGVMEANWDGGGYSEMKWKPLPFTVEDIDLIYRGVPGRSGQAALPGAVVRSRTLAEEWPLVRGAQAARQELR